MLANKLIERINNKTAVISVVGLGYVGLPLAICYAKAGFKVWGIDVDSKKVDSISKGKSYIKHINSDAFEYLVRNEKLNVTTNYAVVKESDAVILCVPTPLDKHLEPDLSYVISSLDAILPHVKEGQIMSLESTTYPGTTEEEIKTRIESKGYKVGENYFVVYSPEREDPGNRNFSTNTIPKIVGGDSENCIKIGVKLYQNVIEKVVVVSSTKAAELTKILENVYRAVNIGLVNEMKIVADKMGIDIWEVIDAAATKPFGFTPFYPGPGLGGHCIPIDPFYLTWKAREFDIHTRFIELAGQINTSMPTWVVDKIIEALNMRGQHVKDSNILILGLAYKKNIDDCRESPSFKIIKLLKDKGAVLKYNDPYVKDIKIDLPREEITKEALSAASCVIIATDHDSYDYDYIQQNSKLIIDTRGRYRKPYDNVFKC